jgi:hypothetical protein
MRIASALLAILMVFLAGTGLTLALWRGTRAILAAELLALGWLLGAGVVSLLLAVGGIALSGAVLMMLVAVACLFFAGIGWRRVRKGLPVESGLAGVPAWEKWLSLLALVPIVYMAYATFRDSMLWDGLVIWETKARSAFLAGGSLPASYFSEASRARYHPSYPLYLPFTELWLYLWVGDSDQTMVKLIFPFFYAAATLLLWSSVLRLTGRACAATATAVLPLFIPLLADHGLGLVEGYADFPLGVVYLAGLSSLLIWRVKGIEGAWPVACACAAVLPWIKQEGIMLLASLAAVAALVHGWSGWRRTALFALPGMAIWLGWKVAMHVVHVVNESVFQPVTVATVLKNVRRLWPILQAMEYQLTLLKNWSVLWYAVPVALICLAWRQRPLAGWLATALVVPLAFDIIPYYFTSLDLFFHITTSFDRLALQVSLAAVLCLGLALGSPSRTPAPTTANNGNAGGGTKP